MIPNLPIEVDITLDNSKNEFSLDILSSQYEVDLSSDEEVKKPIEVELSLDNSTNEFEFDIQSNKYEYDLTTDTAIIVTSGDAEIYEGPYEVDPFVKKETILNTAKKYCKKDITVHKVPKFSTSNEYGTTFYIGEV